MNLLFRMPSLGVKELGAEITEWHVKVGAVVNADDLLVSVKTSDGVTVLRAPQRARVNKIYGNSGDFIRENEPLLELEDLAEPAPITNEDLLKRYAELTEQYGDISKVKEIALLLLRWANLEIYQVKPYVSGFRDTAGHTQYKVIEVANGWKIHDYGDYLVTSRGEDMGVWSTGKLIASTQAMVNLLSQRHAAEVTIYGHELAKRIAWKICADQGIAAVNYVPTTEDFEVRTRLQQLDDQSFDVKSVTRIENR